MTSSVKWSIAWALIIAASLAAAKFGASIRRSLQNTPAPPAVTVKFLDIKSGNCTVIRTPDDRYVLVDDGGNKASDEVVAALRKMGVGRIDLLILASPNDSGLGGTAGLLRANIPIRAAWVNNVLGSSERNRVVGRLNAAGIPVRIVQSSVMQPVGDSRTPVCMSIVWPPMHGDRARRDGLVCRLDYGAQSCLFLGPIAAASEAYVVSGAGLGRCDVLQVTDHGNGDGSSLELLRWAQPEIAVIAATAAEPPEQAALDRLQAAGASIWRTDIEGDVTITLTGGPDEPSITGSHV